MTNTPTHPHGQPESGTPRTDAECFGVSRTGRKTKGVSHPSAEIVLASFARTLELELIAARSEKAMGEEDSQLLDWLLANVCYVSPTPDVGAKLHIFTGPQHSPTCGRSAIRAARARDGRAG